MAKIFNGKRMEIQIPPPYQDEKGVWWFYDPEMGWQSKESMNKVRDMFRRPESPEGVGRIIMIGTGVDHDTDFKSFQEAFSDPSPNGYKVLTDFKSDK